MAKTYSTGRLSNEMKRMIPVQKKQGMTIEEIADRWNRSPVGIRKFLDDEGYVDEDLPVMDDDAHAISLALRKKPYYRNLQAQFDKYELELFEHLWVKMMMEQFRHDLLPAEELQVKQLLTLEILVNRSLEERQRQVKEISQLQKQIDKEYAISPDNRDSVKIDSLEARLAFARGSVSNHTTEHTKLLDKVEKIQKDLKATRDQRVRRIEDSKTTFSGLIRALDDEQYRNRMGHEAELMNIAKDKQLDALGEWHEYGTDTDYAEIDIPILNAETVMRHDDL